MFVQSMLANRGTRLGWFGSVVARLVLVGASSLAMSVPAGASPYTVTDLGASYNVHREDTGNSYTNRKTGASVAFFTNFPRSLTSEEQASLPTALADVTGPASPYPPETVQMQGGRINDSGTILGYITTLINRDNGRELTGAFGYTVPSADGSYSSFVPVSNHYRSDDWNDLYLSQANQILVNDPDGTRLVDVNTGTTTPIAQLMPPQILERFPLGFGGFNIDDRGDIIVMAFGQPGGESETLMLTPPGLDPPSTVPEPSTLLIFAAAGALGLRAAGRRGAA